MCAASRAACCVCSSNTKWAVNACVLTGSVEMAKTAASARCSHCLFMTLLYVTSYVAARFISQATSKTCGTVSKGRNSAVFQPPVMSLITMTSV